MTRHFGLRIHNSKATRTEMRYVELDRHIQQIKVRDHLILGLTALNTVLFVALAAALLK